MEIPFKAKPRAHSVNFLEKFRNKISRVDRHSGIIGALYAQPNRKRHSQTEQSQNDPAQSRAISDKLSHHDQFKKTMLVPLTAIGQQNLSLQNISRQVQLRKQVIEQLKQARKIMQPPEQQQNQARASIVLPPLIRNGYDHQKSIHRVKEMRKQRVQSHWAAEFRNNQSGQPQNHAIEKIR